MDTLNASIERKVSSAQERGHAEKQRHKASETIEGIPEVERGCATPYESRGVLETPKGGKRNQ